MNRGHEYRIRELLNLINISLYRVQGRDMNGDLPGKGAGLEVGVEVEVIVVGVRVVRDAVIVLPGFASGLHPGRSWVASVDGSGV